MKHLYKIIGGYGLWGFYNGFRGTSHYDVKSQNDTLLYTDRILNGIISGCSYVGLAPISIVCDIRKLESYVRCIEDNKGM
jgi:hypothetical protein